MSKIVAIIAYGENKKCKKLAVFYCYDLLDENADAVMYPHPDCVHGG